MARQNTGQRIWTIKLVARARRRLQLVLEAAAEGKSKPEAAEIAGLSVKGVEALLHRELGSSKWPPDQEERSK